MNLLLVDDDILILEDLCQRTDWKKLGVEKVFTAHSAEEALTLFAQVPIHALVCDIEMPGESGLDLLAALHQRHACPPSVVLTSYARFDYAQRALQLGAMEYLLKPVAQGEFEAALGRLLQRVREQARTAETNRYGQYWIDEQRNALEYFWQKAALGKLSQLHGMAEKLGYAAEDRFTPVAVEVFPGENPPQWDAPMFEYALKNILYELLESGFLHPESVAALSENRWLAVVRLQPALALDAAPLEEALNELLDAAKQHLGVQLCCGIGASSSIAGMAGAVQGVLAMLDATFSRSGAVLNVNSYQPAGAQFCTIEEIGLWETLLKNGERDTLLAQVTAYIGRMVSQQELPTSVALAFRQDFTQLVYTFLKQQGIHAHRLFADGHSDALYRGACRSPEGMAAYCTLLVDRALEYASFSQSPQSVVDTLKSYLDAHFSEEVTRGDLANIVYLSPDYLSRLFKKETGKSLVQYITDRRIDYACRLLRETDAPINGIAMQAGFANFAYFSKVFREAMGCTPMEYRKRRPNS